MNEVLAKKYFDESLQLRAGLAKVGIFFANQSWSTATSSNYSHRLGSGSDCSVVEKMALISRTGVDKFEMSASDFLVMNGAGDVLYPKSERSSAETLIHVLLYELYDNANCVLHTHSVEATRLSLRFESEVVFTGYEIQKAMPGLSSHEQVLRIPILGNSQNMMEFCRDLEAVLKTKAPVAFLMRGHGLYTWGSDLASAKRQVEALEFLFQCLALELLGV